VWLSLAVSILAACFFIRMFIIFHDCTHRSFFRSGRANRIWGNITGILTLFPFEKWKHDHAIHHAASGNLDRRGTGDVWVMTVEEYAQAAWYVKLAYRLYRNPFVMFGLGPLYLILIDNRLNHRGAPARERWNTHLTTAAALILYGGVALLAGWQAFLIVQLPIWFLAGLGGIWLFYVQHQFEDSYFENEAEWDYVKAAIDGSSYYKLPKVVQWITGNIGFHHVHHLSPSVPNYRLEQVHASIPQLQQATVVTFRSSLRAIRFRLYDTRRRTFISFREYKAMRKQAVAAETDSRSNSGKAMKIS
jgi:omega-6 fatty acid desaturase (delta-12 desaturase)